MKLVKKGEITHTLELTGDDIMSLLDPSAKTIYFMVPGVEYRVEFSKELSKEPRVIISWVKEST